MSEDPQAGTGPEPVGSVGEEATKLLRALQDWAEGSGSDHAAATASAAAGAASSARRVGEHIATGGEDCRYCPLCQAISAVRATPPDVREHLAAAATSLMHAAASLLATPVPDGAPGTEGSPSVEKIDVSDDEWEDD